MNENPFETKNPLENASPDTQPGPTPTESNPQPTSEPAGFNTQPAVDPVETSPQPEGPVSPIGSGVSSIPGAIVSEPGPTPNQSQTPGAINDFKMRQANLATESPIPQKKTGLIIGIIAAILVFIGAAVAVAILLSNGNKPNNDDVFTKAFEKTLAGGMPEYMETTGKINLDLGEEMSSTFSDISLSIDAKTQSGKIVNDTSLKLSLSFMGTPISLDINEAYTDSNNLFIKLSGLSNIVSNKQITTFLSLASGFDSSSLPTAVKEIDGKWIKIAGSEIMNLISENTNFDADEGAVCIAKAIDTNQISKLYKANPFFMSSSSNITIEKKVNPLYKVSLNATALGNFIASLVKDTTFMSGVFSCQGFSEKEISAALDELEQFDASEAIDIEELEALVTYLPAFYVEIDNEYNITRFYSNGSFGESGIGYTIDFSFKELDKLTVNEPETSLDFTEFLNESIKNLNTGLGTTIDADIDVDPEDLLEELESELDNNSADLLEEVESKLNK